MIYLSYYMSGVMMLVHTASPSNVFLNLSFEVSMKPFIDFFPRNHV
jgi:hypothetical protein